MAGLRQYGAASDPMVRVVAHAATDIVLAIERVGERCAEAMERIAAAVERIAEQDDPHVEVVSTSFTPPSAIEAVAVCPTCGAEYADGAEFIEHIAAHSCI